MVTYLGQFFDHEFDLTGGGSEPAAISIPKCDPKFDPRCTGTQQLPFKRSAFNETSGVRQQINTVTAFLDGSVMYGSSEEVAYSLRSFYKGLMLTDAGAMLPDNHVGIHMEHFAEIPKAAGDVRANVHPPMLAFQTLFVREHNRMAKKLSEENPSWNDETLYREARKWTVAFLQAICWYEYLPSLGIHADTYQGYDPEVNPSIDNFFATVSYRYGHSEIKELIRRVDDKGHEIEDGHMLLHQHYFSPKKSLNADIGPIFRGLSMTMTGEVDTYFASSIQHYLFGTPGLGGTDLIALDIQRSRDHGTADYNTARQELGLERVTSFSQITSDSYAQRAMEVVYGSVDNIDAFVGGMAEDPLENSSLGALFYASMKDQYERMRDGDRFYFENKGNNLFTDDEIEEIKGTSLRDVILRNTEVQVLPENIYIIQDPTSPWPRENGGSAPAPEQTGSRGEVTLKGDATLEYWTEGPDAHFIIKAPVAGWVALGVEGPGGMIDADIIIGSVDGDQKGEVVDTWSTAFIQPSPDVDEGGSNDVTLQAFEEKDGFTKIHFSRPLEATDDKDRAINLDAETKFIFAWHETSDALEYHGIGNRGKVAVTLSEGGGSGDGGDEGGEIVLGGSLELADGAYKVSWIVDQPAGRKLLQDGGQKVHFTATLEGEGWMGLGLSGEAGGMIGADIIIATMTPDGDCDVQDYWSESFAAPAKDKDNGGNDDITDVTCTRDGGVTEFKFSRPVATSDETDLPFNPEGITPIIYAWSGDSDSVGYHGAANRGSAEAETVATETGGGGEGGGGGSTGDLVFAEAQLNGNFALLWAHDGEDEIVIKMRLSLDAWMGIGLEPEDKGMTNCDMYLGTFDGGSVHVGDYWSAGYAQPGDDASAGGSNDLIDFGGSQEGGVSEVWFRRKMDTGDALDMTIKDESVDLVFAWGSSPSLGYHGPAQRTLVSINLASADASVSTQVDIGRRMIESHGGIMVIAWAFIGIVGVGIARFGRGWRYWLKAHRILQIGTTVVALIGEVIGFSYTRGSFRTAHSITALCVVFVTFPQVSLGAAAMRKSSNPNYNKLHRGTGYFLVGLALWQVWTGLLTLEVGSMIKNMYLTWILALLVAFHFSSTLLTQKEVDLLLKDAHAPTQDKKQRRKSGAKQMSRGSRGAGALLAEVKDLEEDKDEESHDDTDTEKKNDKAKRGAKSSKTSQELIELLIDDRSSDDGGSDNDSDNSDGATGWSRTDGDGSMMGDTTITSEDFLTGVQEGKKWTIINDVVYDMTFYVAEHPGGQKVLEDITGMDGTDSFLEVHGGDRKVLKILQGLTVGDLNDSIGILDNEDDREEERRGSLLHRARTSLAGVLGGKSRLGAEQDPVRTSDVAMLGPSKIPSAMEDNTWKAQPEQQLPKLRSLIPTASEPEVNTPTVGLARKVWKDFPVVDITEVNDDVVILHVEIPDCPDVTLPITSHIMIKGTDPATNKVVNRAFTPLIPDQDEYPGRMDILIKCYEDGRMSRYIRTLKPGDCIPLKGPMRGVEYHNGKFERIGLIGGGSGITPLWQVIEGILKNPDDNTKISLVYQNRYEKDILLRDEIDAMARKHSNQFRVCYVLSQPPSGWVGFSGRINADMLAQQLPPAHLSGSYVMVCGPPAMCKSLGGEFDAKIMERGPGILSQLGFTKNTMHIYE
ncbi:hypothetical protein BSKO_01713 [Bryopsis sp. KO-2023]|nr:hypothetical protein BSKO_01713 [Bryopsis sp. KO-2023]